MYGVGRDVLDLEINPLKQTRGRKFSVAQGISVGQWREIPA